ncbi:hypothetical protein BC826DRAFT_229461 [Russula brevipes]|nr:hypothetical protein BC826DRAFT_229461 [Russula brevipes]
MRQRYHHTSKIGVNMGRDSRSPVSMPVPSGETHDFSFFRSIPVLAIRTDDRGAAFSSASNHHIEIFQVTYCNLYFFHDAVLYAKLVAAKLPGSSHLVVYGGCSSKSCMPHCVCVPLQFGFAPCSRHWQRVISTVQYNVPTTETETRHVKNIGGG